MSTPDDSAAPDGSGPTPGKEPLEKSRAIDSTTLLAGRQEVIIRHGGREYRLRRTRLDKLILTA